MKSIANSVEKENDVQVIIDTPRVFLGGKYLNNHLYDNCKKPLTKLK